MSDAPVVLPGAGLFVPSSRAAMLQHALMAEPALADIRAAALEVAREYTERSRAASCAAGSAVAAPPAAAASCDRVLAGWPRVAAVARGLGISQQRVRELLAEGKLTGRKIGQHWVISPESVERRLGERGVVGAAPGGCPVTAAE